jgi:hypothetical protein
MRAPIGVLKRTVIRGVFSHSVRNSGVRIPFQGAHCPRHSLAVHFRKSGTSLKIIGGVLGHRSAVSTSTYLRLATGDLREASLPVLTGKHAGKGGLPRFLFWGVRGQELFNSHARLGQLATYPLESGVNAHHYSETPK